MAAGGAGERKVCKCRPVASARRQRDGGAAGLWRDGERLARYPCGARPATKEVEVDASPDGI
eukprot:2137912-Prymnesium_polylepis.2